MAKTVRELAETVTESVKTAATKLTGGPKKRVARHQWYPYPRRQCTVLPRVASVAAR
jgi:hypothetical protein